MFVFTNEGILKCNDQSCVFYKKEIETTKNILKNEKDGRGLFHHDWSSVSSSTVATFDFPFDDDGSPPLAGPTEEAVSVVE
jgi:hypothetical protein